MNKGILYGIGAYLIWGFFPVYIKLLKTVPALEILGHRIFWSCLFLFGVLLIKKQFKTWRLSVFSQRTIFIYSLSALLLAVNWLTYIYAVNSNQVVESSLGYFINPLVSVLFGVVFLRERLRLGQWLAVSIAALGVVYLTWNYGRLPWIALVLAVSFGLYGLVKKISPLGSLFGLSLETTILLVPAFLFLIWVQSTGSGSISTDNLGLSLILMLSGVVTAIPLLLFGAAARSIPLSMVGILQYIAPTCQFLLGVLVYQEAFTSSRLVGFVIIWTALGVFWLEGYLYRRQSAVFLPAKP